MVALELPPPDEAPPPVPDDEPPPPPEAWAGVTLEAGVGVVAIALAVAAAVGEVVGEEVGGDVAVAADGAGVVTPDVDVFATTKT